MMISLVTLLPLLAVAEAVKVVSMNIAKNPVAQGKNINPRGLGKRGSVTASLINNATSGAYLATVQVGTPGQTMTLVLDTGSSDVWVLSKDAATCDNPQDLPGLDDCWFGTFDSNSSSTFKDILPGGFTIQYEDASEATGDYFTDDLTFGNATVKNLQMGLGTGSTSTNIGIMGIGYDTNEAAIEDGGTKYPSIIDELVSQGLINIEAYSLYLDDLFTSTGSILFGGIDTAKYSGSLISIPIQSDPTSGDGSALTSFTVALTSLTVTNGSTTTSIDSNITEAVILDSGTTVTYLPDSIVKKIYKPAGVIDDSENSGLAFINCDANTSDISYNYQFGGSNGPTISVAFSELLQKITDEQFEEMAETPPFENTCSFGILPAGDSPSLLGDTFLRSAYVVYDLKNNEIGLAQTHFNSDSSNVVEIPSSASGIPFVSGVASGVSVTQTATGQPGIGQPIPSGSSSITGSSIATITTGIVGDTTSASSSPSSSSSVSSSASASVSSSSASSASSLSSKSASGTASSASSSQGAAVSSIPAFDLGALLVLTVSGIFSVMGGAWFIL